jgi:hypothetical protein
MLPVQAEGTKAAGREGRTTPPAAARRRWGRAARGWLLLRLRLYSITHFM